MSHPNPPNTRIQKDEQSPRRTLRALLDFTFLRYCVVGALASGVFYGVANLSALLLKVDSRSEAQNLESTFENAQNVGKPAQDSRTFDKNAEILQNNDSTNAARRQDLGDKNGALQGESRAHTLAYVTADSPQQSPFLAPKPTPEPSQILATLLGSLASFIFGYFAQMRLAFRANPNHSTMLPRYLALLALIAIYAQAIAYLGAFFTLSYYAISAFIALSVPLFSYPLQKLWVFAGTSKGGGRLSKDSACGLESAIASSRFVDRPQVLSSVRGLKSHDSISKILESLFLLSLRDTAPAVAWQTPLRHCEPMKSAWQFIKSIQPYTKSLESIFQKMDSRGNALLSPFLWLIGIAPRPSIRPLLFAPCSNFSKTNALFAAAKLMDCHATASALARNDRNNATSKKVDSRSKAQPAHHDSKHCSGALHSIPKPKHHRRQDF